MDRVSSPLHWYVATRTRTDLRQAVNEFRTAYPDAQLILLGRGLPVLAVPTPTPPAVPGSFRPYGVARCIDGERTDTAAWRAVIAATLARHYKLQGLDAAEIAPLVHIFGSRAHEREAFLRASLGPLHADDRRRYLLDTLQAYLSHDLCVAAAARSLYVHRHTLTYRLECVRKLTGLDLESPFDRLRAELALVLSRSQVPVEPRPQVPEQGWRHPGATPER